MHINIFHNVNVRMIKTLSVLINWTVVYLNVLGKVQKVLFVQHLNFLRIFNVFFSVFFKPIFISVFSLMFAYVYLLFCCPPKFKPLCANF